MRISKYLLPVTLAFIAYCSTFTIAKSVIQVKSSTLDFKRKLIDESHRHLREDVAKDDEEKEYVVPREKDEKGRVTKGKDEERRGGGGGNDDVAGANPLYAPPVTKFYPSYFENKEKLERWFKKKAYTKCYRALKQACKRNVADREAKVRHCHTCKQATSTATFYAVAGSSQVKLKVSLLV